MIPFFEKGRGKNQAAGLFVNDHLPTSRRFPARAQDLVAKALRRRFSSTPFPLRLPSIPVRQGERNL
jgi:hypothetical protein